MTNQNWFLQLKPSSVSRLSVENQLNENECEQLTLFTHTTICVLQFNNQVYKSENERDWAREKETEIKKIC